MKSVYKVSLFVYLIVLSCLFGLIAAIPFISDYRLQSVYNFILDYKWYIFIIALLLILVNIKFMISAVHEGKGRKFAIVKYTEDGQVNISNDTIKSLALKTLSQIRGVKESKVYIRPNNNGKIDILVKSYVIPDVNIPETVKTIQDEIKSYIESIAEIPVGEIIVYVLDILPNNKMHLE